MNLPWTPAICGGRPALASGPPRWPPDDPEIADALQRAYRDGSWGSYHGPNGEAIIARLREMIGVEHAMLCSSGTIAVEIALRGVGVEPDDEVILAGYDFPGNFRAIEAIGALPVLVDLDPASRCLDVAQVAAACGPRTKAVVATHLHGGLVDMPRLAEIAKAHGIAVVEDVCQAPGAIVAGRPAGAWGDVAVFSFGGSKLLTAGRGGAIVTPRADIMQRMKIYCDRGNQAFPLSELQAAVLLPQLEKLPARHAQRLRAARRLSDRLSTVPGLSPAACSLPDSEPAYYKLGILYEAESVGGCTREQFAAAARAEGIALDTGFRGFTRRGGRRCRRVGELPVATSAGEQTLVLHHPVLLEADVVIDLVGIVLSNLTELFRRGGVDFLSLPSATTTGSDDRPEV